ncbi:MAG TPA: TOMM precursor leader peptide-binding protein [Bryobacteraceae bacterium]|nr:TOMM precursor leader peptide-binding protein [Bryobacteraceae bacterium]
MAVEIGERRIRLRPYLRHYEAPGAGIFLVSEHESCLLREPIFRKLIPLLDARAAVSRVHDLLGTGLEPIEIFRALDFLRRNEYVEEQSDELPLPQASFWQTIAAGINASERLSQNPVRLIVTGRLDPQPLKSLLTDSGLRVDDESRRWLVVTSDYLHREVRLLGEEARGLGAEWLLCRPVGTEIWIGPVFGLNCCWHCMAHRLEGHRKAMTYLSSRLGNVQADAPDVPHLAATLHLGYAIAATQAAHWAVQGPHGEMSDSILAVNPMTLQQTRHRVTRRQQCPACGDPGLVAARQWQPVTLSERLIPIEFDNGHRICRLEDTERRLQTQISPVTGLVGALRGSALHGKSPEFSQSFLVEDLCGRRDFTASRMGRQRAAGGKGITAVQARVSALSEAVERYSGEFQGDEARVTGSLRSLGNRAIHPNACMLFSDLQYAERETWNSSDLARDTIPEPLLEDAEIEWCPVWPLSGGDAKYLPTAYCFYDAGGEGSRYAIADSNGCAAGNCREEAILQGFFEIVERDAVAIWWYNRLSRPSVDLRSFQDEFFNRAAEYHASLHRELWLLDLTTDLGIPVFAALSRRTDKEAEDILLGFGAHLDARIAIQRALTEVNQSLPAVAFVGINGESYPGGNREAIAWWQAASLRSEPYLAASCDDGPKTRSSYPYAEPRDLRGEVMECVRRAAARGLSVFLLDQTRPDTGLDVIRVIVPGLRHFRARFAPGRLYDVPVNVGWLPRATDERDLNRQCIYF